MSMPTVTTFAKRLIEMGYHRIYLSHYENEAEARKFAESLRKHGLDVTVAADARKLGKDFVSKCIADSNLTIVLDPERDAERLIFHVGGTTYSIRWD